MKKEEKKVVRESYVTTFVAIDGNGVQLAAGLREVREIGGMFHQRPSERHHGQSYESRERLPARQ